MEVLVVVISAFAVFIAFYLYRVKRKLNDQLISSTELSKYLSRRVKALDEENKSLAHSIQSFKTLYSNEMREVGSLKKKLDSNERLVQELEPLSMRAKILDKENLKLTSSVQYYKTLYDSERREVNNLQEELGINERLLRELLNCEDGFCGFSQMYTDYKDGVSSLKQEDRVNLYKYEYLLSIFPELSDYVDNYNPFQDKIFKKRCWREGMTVDEEQMALDEFCENEKKSKIAYGTAYEMYIGYLMRDDGWTVIQYGVEMGFKDKGRDLICSKVTEGVAKVYVIQCKNWAEWKQIPELYICQLFGTTYEYKKEHAGENLIVEPLFISSCKLSEDAVEFCRVLGVKYRVLPFGHFPRVKCNISKTGRKIYHLPFDRQYNSTKINKPDEMYAWTVQEARDAGFVRAKQ
jgi:hypothetical protein